MILKVDNGIIDVMLMGDLNLPIIKWKTGNIAGGSRDEQAQARHLLNLTENYFMEQIVQEPTRRNNILDLVFVNNHSLIYDINISKTIISDHNMIEITTNLQKNQVKIRYH